MPTLMVKMKGMWWTDERDIFNNCYTEIIHIFMTENFSLLHFCTFVLSSGGSNACHIYSITTMYFLSEIIIVMYNVKGFQVVSIL
jgi:hypothetical protein